MRGVSVSPIRVLHVYSGNMFGGVETALVSVAQSHGGAASHEFCVFWDARLASDLRKVGGRVHVLSPVRWRKPWSVIDAQRRFARLLRREGFDVVVAHAGWSFGICAPVARWLGVPVVFFQHDVSARSRFDWLLRACVPDAVFVNSRFVAATAPGSRGGRSPHVQWLPLALRPTPPPAVRESLRREFGVAQEARVVLIAARFEPWKGHQLLFDALGRAPDASWVLWVAGAPQTEEQNQYFADLKARARHLEAEGRVRFLGYRADVWELMAAADVYCQPNIGPEPYGMVFVEALAAGLPVVTTSMGGALEIVDSSCGHLVEGSAAAVADGIRSAFEHLPRLREAAKRRGRSQADPAARMNELDAALLRVATEKP